MRPSKTVYSLSLRKAFNFEKAASPAELPLFLCPAAIRPASRATLPKLQPRIATRTQTCRLHTDASSAPVVLQAPPPPRPHPPSSPPASTTSLPVVCSGCGALSQTSLPGQAGYYDLERKAVQTYLGTYKEETHVRPENHVVQDALQSAALIELGKKLGKDDEALKSLRSLATAVRAMSESSETPKTPEAPPLCDRCHKLVHHQTGNPIFHPTIKSIKETIEESPYKYNHVYHVIDAADFPMSVLPNINQLLDLMPLRSLNRRSRTGRFVKGQKTEMSFVITRSDLLGAKKEHVDHLMPYLTETLRNALGRKARNIRMGNIWCVSAKRNWWTTDLKEEVWKRGGALWMVGKVNVGKSQLFREIFPKGRMDWKPPKHEISVDVFPITQDEAVPKKRSSGLADEFSLLPPPQEEINYPAMPVVSALPGTTASPIRVPFGNGRGELIDLPGLARSDLEVHVKEEHRDKLIMKSRITPEQQVLKPGQSLLIGGGLIRITPKTPNLVFLAYSFTPIKPHLTSTEKAVAVQEQSEEAPNVENICVLGTGALIKRAGDFELAYDVTKERAGPITRKEAANISVSRLPYRVMGIDILIEGCGWVEIVAQVRKRDFPAPAEKTQTHSELKMKKVMKKKAKPDGDPGRLQSLDLSDDTEAMETAAPHSNRGDSTERDMGSEAPNELNSIWPMVEVFSPEGKFIASRPPMNGWMMNKPKKSTTKSRPRPSMRGAKKRVKLQRQTVGSRQDAELSV